MTTFTHSSGQLCSDEDHFLSLSETSKICEQIEGANILNIPFAGHEAFKDSAEQFLITVNRFLLNPGSTHH